MSKDELRPPKVQLDDGSGDESDTDFHQDYSLSVPVASASATGPKSPSIRERVSSLGMAMVGAAAANIMSCPGPRAVKLATDKLMGNIPKTNPQEEEKTRKADTAKMSEQLQNRRKLVDLEEEQLNKVLDGYNRMLTDTGADKEQQKLMTQLTLANVKRFRLLHTSFCEELVNAGLLQLYLDQRQLSYMTEAQELALQEAINISTNPVFNQPQFQNNRAETPQYQDYRHMRLPKLDLPKFDGNVRQWLNFKSAFQPVIDNQFYTDVEKFQYLVQSLVPDSAAYKVVATYPAASSDYEAAFDDLQRQFGNKKTLIKVYVRDLLKLVVENAKEKPNLKFTDLVNSLQSQIRNLEVLGISPSKYGELLYPVVESCIPPRLLEAYLATRGCQQTLPDLLSYLNDEVQRKMQSSLARSPFAEDKKKGDQQAGGKSSGSKNGKGDKTTTFLNAADAKCGFCNNTNHQTSDCKNAKKMTLEEKKKALSSSKVCWKCLQPGNHRLKKCWTNACASCGKGHNTMLCPGETQPSSTPSSGSSKGGNGGDNQQQKDATPDTTTTESLKNSVTSSDSSEVPLQILSLKVMGENGKSKLVRALLDTGSQKSYIVESLQQELNFPKINKVSLIHNLFGGETSTARQHDVVKVKANGIGVGIAATFDVVCIPRITNSISIPPPGPWLDEFGQKGVTFTAHPRSASVELLIGNDIAPRLYTGKIVDLGNGPVAMETRWGWVLCGKLPSGNNNNTTSTMATLNITSTLVNSSITQLWDLDLIGIRDEPATQSKTELTRQTEEHFLRTVNRTEDGRYEVHLPFHAGESSNLPSNYNAAERRLKNTTDNLRKSGYLQQYDELLRQWEAEDMIERVATGGENNWKENGHFLPHRAVIKESSATTPVRPVYDASAKAKGRPSLNMCLEPGPNYLELIPSILTRFRLNSIGVTADIRKAFMQISIVPEHRKYLQFLWYEDPANKDKIIVFQHTRVVFGVTCSPFLLAATLKYHLNKSQPIHLETARRLIKSLYVDNCVESFRSINEADLFQKESVKMLEPAKFDLRGWERGPIKDKKEIPVLGLIWDMQKDELRVDISAALEKVNAQLCMRTVLAMAHSLFDPLGLLSPYILIAKQILRKGHEEKLGWDKPLPHHMVEEVKKWSSQLNELSKAVFPRHVHLDNSDETSLQVFCDASGGAYAAVVFLRCVTPKGIIVSLLLSKARIATKSMRVTIPRMELIGCLIGARLAKTVLEDMGGLEIPVQFYTDSTTALAWIQGEGPWAVFVHNRVREILTLTQPTQWRHVRGEDNPADLPSRGCSAKKLVTSEWWRGPEWLQRPENEWPVSTNYTPDQEAIDLEKKIVIATTVAVPTEPHPLTKINNISSYLTMKRMTGWWVRYRSILLERIRNPAPAKLVIRKNLSKIKVAPLLHNELETAEKIIIQYIQRDLDLKKNNFKKLRPFQSDGIWRTHTPVFTDEDQYFVNPIILPEKNQIVQRIIRNLHDNNCHIGTQLLRGKLREKFWVIGGRNLCREVVRKCWICQRWNARPVTVPEPPLPSDRTDMGVAFRVIGVDIAGPFILKTGDKVWAALFTCAVYRAIHIEVVREMSTKEFFRAFRDYTNRRGVPKVVYSDNGLNFVGASAALRIQQKRDIDQIAAKDGIEWRHQPPNAPWWGGFFERMIGLVKSLLRKSLGPRKVYERELVSLLIEVEEACNNRPLTYLSETHDDPVPLTPNMMVRNSGTSYFPELDMRDATSAKATYKRMQRFREMLRSRFRLEYLGALQNRRNNGTFQPLKEGDVVLIEHENEKRHGWPLGIITGGIPGRDGFTRQFIIKTNQGTITRAAQKLYIMEMGERAINGADQEEDN